MTDEEQKPPLAIRRFRWAKSRNPFAKEIEAVAALWVEGFLNRAQARQELQTLEQIAEHEVKILGRQILARFGEVSQDHAKIIIDIQCVREAIDASERREDATPNQRLATLLENIKRLQHGGLQR